MSERLLLYSMFGCVAATAGLAIAGASMLVAIAPIGLWAGLVTLWA